MDRAPARILFVNHTAGISGPTYSLLMLVRYLRDRYDVAVLLPEEGALCELLTNEGVDHFIIPGLRKQTIFKIFQLIHREGFDLVYGNTPSGCSRNAMLAAKLARKPFIWHIRSMKWNWTWRKSFFLPWADEIVTVSRACAEPLKRFYPRDIHIVYNGVELSSFDVDRVGGRRCLAEQLVLSPDAQYVISVSHLMPRKGYEQAIAAMAQIVPEMANAHLVVAGRLNDHLDYTDNIRTMIQQQGLGDHVHLLGLRTDIPWLLRGSDVFLHTANSEGHPRVVIEAMAAGLPVVAFAVDGVAETVVDRETGYLLPLGDVKGMADAVRSLLEAPAQAAEMGQRGRERVLTHFTATQTAARIAQIIEDLL